MRAALLQSSPRTTFFRRACASVWPNDGYLRAELCLHFMPETGRKRGYPPGWDKGGLPEGDNDPQKCSDGAPRSAFQTSAEAGKVMKYSIFSAPGGAERLLEWGGASVRPRAEIFMRGGGSLLAGLSSVCACVRHTQKEPKKGLKMTEILLGFALKVNL